MLFLKTICYDAMLWGGLSMLQLVCTGKTLFTEISLHSQSLQGTGPVSVLSFFFFFGLPFIYSVCKIYFSKEDATSRSSPWSREPSPVAEATFTWQDMCTHLAVELSRGTNPSEWMLPPFPHLPVKSNPAGNPAEACRTLHLLWR